VFAAPLIRVSLGERWVAAASLTQILVWAGAATALAEIVGQMIIRIGEPRLVTWSNLMKTAILASTFYPLLKAWQNEGIAWSLLGGSVVGLAIQVRAIHRLLEAAWRDLARTAARGVLASLPFLMVWAAANPARLGLWGAAAAAAGSLGVSGGVLLALFRRRTG
jgi:O-antigen/teichoic acid export membrane protein